MNESTFSIPSSAADFFYAALPANAKEERFFVLTLDGHGKVLADPILVSVGHKDGTAQIDVATFSSRRSRPERRR